MGGLGRYLRLVLETHSVGATVDVCLCLLLQEGSSGGETSLQPLVDDIRAIRPGPTGCDRREEG